MGHIKRIAMRIGMGLVFVATVALGVTPAARTQDVPAARADHLAWVGSVMLQMETVKVGMTRADLLKVFTTEGGLSGGLRRTFVSRECPFFKVAVEFEAVGRPARDANGRVTLLEDPADRIAKISQPYLQRRIMD